MLSRESLDSALPLVDRLDTHRVVLSPIAGSHIESLNRATRATTLFTVPTDNGELMPDVNNIEIVTNTKNATLGFSDHDILMDDLAETCGDAVRKHVSYARTVVTPTILDLVEKVSTAQKQTPSISSLLGLEVAVWNPPLPLLNAGFAESLKEFEDVSFNEPRFAFSLPARSFEELVAMMETGKSSVDSDVRAWAATKGASFFLDVWAEMFQNRPSGQGATQSFYQLTSSAMNGPDTALAVYLLARRMVQDPVEDSGMGRDAYNNASVDFRDQAALRLVALCREMKTAQQAGVLVRSIAGKVTTVNGEVYKDWIENGGGSNEVLYGNALSNAPVYTVEQLNSIASDLKAYWHRHETATILTENRGKFNRDMAMLRAAFEAQLREIQDPVEANPTNLNVVRKLFEQELGNVVPDSFKDLPRLCMRLVCRSRYYKTDAEFILEAGEEVKRQFPNIDPREAYAMATLEYIIRWVLSQSKATVVPA
jgi:hypothetical protein